MPKSLHPSPLFAWIWRGYLRRYWRPMTLALVLMAIEGSMFGLLSYMMKPLFDRVFVGGDQDALIWVGLAVFAVFVTRAVTGVAQKVVLNRVSERSMADLRQDMLAHMMALEPAFHQRYGPGYLIQRVEGDVGAIGKLWSTVITGAGRDAVALVALFAVAVSIDWRWTLVALLGVPLMIAPAVGLQRYVRRNARLARDVAAGLSVRLNEIFHGIETVKLNALEAYQARRYGTLTRERIRRSIRSAFGTAALPGLIDLMSGVGFVAVLFFGAGEILEGDKTVGDFMAFFTAVALAFEPLRRLGALSGAWQVAAASIERIREIMETPVGIADPPHPKPRPGGVPALRFEDVHVNFGGAPALRGLSFTAEAGRTTALVGPSGAGKSTVFKLIARMAEPDAGRVTLGGVPVDAMRLADLRACLAVVSQETLLFDETLRENIALDLDPDAEQLRRAVEAAHVDDFLPQLANGLDSRVGPRGSNLSGGQRQRVAIARAVLRDRPVLLLDEATSALDAQSETLVQAALDRLSAGRTTLVIAHRLSTIRTADKIVVLEAGRVVEEGTHETLLARDGAYRALHRLQAETGTG